MPGPNHPSFQNLQRITAAQLNGLLDSTVTRGNPRVGQIAIRGSRLITAASVDLLARLNGGNNSNAAGAGGASREIPAVSVGQNYELAELNALAAQGIRYGRRAEMNNLAEGEPILDTNNHLWIWSGSGWLSLRREQPSMAAIANISQLSGSALSLQLPAASGGSGQFTYALTGAPSWVKRSGRNLSGTFAYRASAWRLTWTATDAVSGLEIARSFSLQSTGIPLSAPSGFRATAILNAQLTLRWDAVANTTRYEYRYAQGTSAPTGSWTNAGTATSALITGLSWPVDYTFQIRAVGTAPYLTSVARQATFTTIRAYVIADAPQVSIQGINSVQAGYIRIILARHTGGRPAALPAAATWGLEWQKRRGTRTAVGRAWDLPDLDPDGWTRVDIGNFAFTESGLNQWIEVYREPDTAYNRLIGFFASVRFVSNAAAAPGPIGTYEYA